MAHTSKNQQWLVEPNWNSFRRIYWTKLNNCYPWRRTPRIMAHKLKNQQWLVEPKRKHFRHISGLKANNGWSWRWTPRIILFSTNPAMVGRGAEHHVFAWPSKSQGVNVVRMIIWTSEMGIQLILKSIAKADWSEMQKQSISTIDMTLTRETD